MNDSVTQKVRHIVMFDFDKLEEGIRQTLINEFVALSKVPEVKAFEWGTENNAEDSPLGFSHCFILTFDGFEDRTRYLNSAEHRTYEKHVMEHRNQVLVFDYAVQLPAV